MNSLRNTDIGYVKKFSEGLHSLKTDNRGVAAIFISMILMVIISIIVLGFSEVSRTEQTAALNKQLSTQAFYAAESGVNDAYSELWYIDNNPSLVPFSGIPPSAAAGCNDPTTDPIPPATSSTISNPYYQDVPGLGPTSILDSSSNTQYPCLEVDASPNTLAYKPLPGQPVIAHFNVVDPPPYKERYLTFTWLNQDPITGQSDDITSSSNSDTGCIAPPLLGTNHDQLNTNGLFPPEDQGSPWKDNCPSALEISIIPGWTGAATQTSIINSGRTFYVYPSSAFSTPPDEVSGPPDLDSLGVNKLNNGDVFAAACHQLDCQFRMQIWKYTQAPTPITDFYIKIQPIYNTQNLEIDLQADNGFTNSQADIDVTGEAQNQVRRIRVSVDLNGNNNAPVPIYAIQSNQSICKRIIDGYQTSASSDFNYENIPNSSTDTPTDILGIFGANESHSFDSSFDDNSLATAPPDLLPSSTNVMTGQSSISNADPCDPNY